MVNSEGNKMIADMLAEYRRAKTEVKEVRAELLRLAVEEIGVDQESVMKCDIEVFLDGYLVGQGMIQKWRKQALHSR